MKRYIVASILMLSGLAVGLNIWYRNSEPSQVRAFRSDRKSFELYASDIQRGVARYIPQSTEFELPSRLNVLGVRRIYSDQNGITFICAGSPIEDLEAIYYHTSANPDFVSELGTPSSVVIDCRDLQGGWYYIRIAE